MRPCFAFPLVAALLGMFAEALPAQGQYRNNPLRNAEMHGQLRLQGRAGRPSFRSPRTYQQRTYQGALTRTEQLRRTFPIPQPRQWLRTAPQPPRSPVSNMLESQNLLRARSTIGQQVVERFGRRGGSVAVSPAIGQGSPAGPTLLSPADQPASDQTTPISARPANDLEALLRQKTDDQFELGLSYYRNRDWGGADRCFTIVRSVEHDQPRGYIADVFVSFQKQYYARAAASLLRAIQLAETPEALKIDRFLERMHEGNNIDDQRRAFRSTVETANLLAAANPDAMLAALLQAYFSWLNGDLGTAASALNRAAKNADDKISAQRLEKFRTMLNQPAGSQPATSPAGP